MSDNEIRINWYEALETGNAIGSKIGWGFSPQDLFILCDLHEAGYFREKIVDLLEDCNFHTECGLIDEGKYAECRKVIAEDIV